MFRFVSGFLPVGDAVASKAAKLDEHRARAGLASPCRSPGMKLSNETLAASPLLDEMLEGMARAGLWLLRLNMEVGTNGLQLLSKSSLGMMPSTALLTLHIGSLSEPSWRRLCCGAGAVL